MAETGEDAIGGIVAHAERAALDLFGIVEQPPVGRRELRVPIGVHVGSVAVGLALRGAAAAERRGLRFGGKVLALLEIPAFVVRVRHDELLAERRTSVDEKGPLFCHRNAESFFGRQRSRFDFEFRHTFFRFVPFVVQGRQELFRDGNERRPAIVLWCGAWA